MREDVYVNLDPIVSANTKFQTALKLKAGVPQAKQYLANLLIANADTLCQLIEENSRLRKLLQDVEEENDALNNAMVDQHKQIAELKAAAEGATRGGPTRKKVSDGACEE